MGNGFITLFSLPLYVVEILHSKVFIKKLLAGFPGGAVVKNLPASSGDTGSSPGPGRSHMLRSN